MREEVSYHVVRYAVASWLRYYKQCPLVCFERGGSSYGWDHPDIFAVTKNRQTFDVEIKMSFSDFLADGKKTKFQKGYEHLKRPTWFYYAAPKQLAEKIAASKDLCPFAGVLAVTKFVGAMGQDGIEILKYADKNDGKRPSSRSLVEWTKHQSGTLCRLAELMAKYSLEAKP